MRKALAVCTRDQDNPCRLQCCTLVRSWRVCGHEQKVEVVECLLVASSVGQKQDTKKRVGS